MFHLINKAWVDILARQIRDKKIESVLCVYTNPKELRIIVDAIRKYNLYFKMNHMPVRYLKEIVKNKVDLPMDDDILISHDLNDIYVKDYLAKRCKRINKNIK